MTQIKDSVKMVFKCEITSFPKHPGYDSNRADLPVRLAGLPGIRMTGKSGKLPLLGQQSVPAQHGGKVNVEIRRFHK